MTPPAMSNPDTNVAFSCTYSVLEMVAFVIETSVALSVASVELPVTVSEAEETSCNEELPLTTSDPNVAWEDAVSVVEVNPARSTSDPSEPNVEAKTPFVKIRKEVEEDIQSPDEDWPMLFKSFAVDPKRSRAPDETEVKAGSDWDELESTILVPAVTVEENEPSTKEELPGPTVREERLVIPLVKEFETIGPLTVKLETDPPDKGK